MHPWTSFRTRARFASVLALPLALYGAVATAQDATLVREIVPGTVSANPWNFSTIDGRVLFSAITPGAGRTLWITDGTTAGTVPVADVRPDTGDPSLFPEAVLDGKAYLRVTDDTRVQLWVSDGTAAGTQPLTSFDTPITLRGVRAARHRVLFRTDPPGAFDIWTTDGTAAGTTGVDVSPTPLCAAAFDAFSVAMADRYYCEGSPQTLQRTGATPGDGALVADLSTPSPSAGFDDARTIDGRTYFSSVTEATGREPWVTDGTAAGTFALGNLNPGAADSLPQSFTRVDGRVYFTAIDGTGWAIYRTDGTAAGTVRVRTVTPSAAGAAPAGLRDVDGALVFRNDDGTNGSELWRSDGTLSGTRLLADIRPGASGSLPIALAAPAGRLLFLASDGVNGREFWETDGTEAGTRRIAQVEPGSASVGASEFAYTAGQVVFTRNTAEAGLELHALDVVTPEQSAWCSTTPTPLHDLDTTDSVIVYPDDGTLADLDVSVDVHHSYVGDLRITLTHVDTGTAVELVNRPSSGACSGDHLDVRFDDDAELQVQSSCTSANPAWPRYARFLPREGLSVLGGERAGGAWRLEIADAGPGDTGTLHGWCLRPTVVADDRMFDDGFE